MPRPSAILSTLLAILLAFSWQRSHTSAHGIILLLDGGRAWGVGFVEGQILLTATDIKFGPRRAWSAETFAAPIAEMNDLRAILLDDGNGGTRGKWNFAAHAGQTTRLPTGPSWTGTFAFPHWLVIALLLLPPLLWLKSRLTRTRRIRAGHCPACNYDLRASADKLCPECGSREHLPIKKA